MKKSLAIILVILLVLCVGAGAVLGVRLYAARTEVTDLTAERDQLNASTQALTNEKEAAASEYAEKLAALEKDLTGLSEELEARDESYVAAQGEISTLNDQVVAAQGEISALNDQALAAQEEISTLNDQVLALQDELAAANAQLETAEDELAAANAQLKTAQDDLAESLSVNSTIAELENSLSEAQANLTLAELSDQQRVETISDLQSRLDECTAELEDCREEYDALLEKLTATEEDLAGKSSLLDETSDELETRTKEAEALTARAEALSASLETAQEELSGARALLAEAEKDRDANAAEADQLRQDAETLAQSADDEKAELLSQLAEAQTERDALADQVKSLAGDLNKYLTAENSPKFESDDLALRLTMPAHTRLIAFNGLLHIVDADETAQVELSVWADENDEPYAPDDIDINQLWGITLDRLLEGGEARPETTETTEPAGRRIAIADEESERIVWLFAGESRLYLMEAVGEPEAVENLIEQILNGAEFR